MKFSSREDIEVPAEFTFGVLTDFSGIEDAARRRDVLVQRLDSRSEPGVGMSWDIRFRFRGKQRALIADVRRLERPEVLEVAGQTTSFDLTMVATVVALTKKRSRLLIELEVRPRTLGARLMLQSAKLGKTALSRRYADKIKALGDEITARHAKNTAV